MSDVERAKECLPNGLSMVEAPSAVGMDEAGLQGAREIVDEAVALGVKAASLCVVRGGRAVLWRNWGADYADPFLVASLTKPIVGLALLSLVAQGRVALTEPVAARLPEFAANGKEGILFEHLLTHTSGLPDMAPSNLELRARHAPLDAFYQEVAQLRPLFEPGTRVRYQSMGFLVIQQAVERIGGAPLQAVLRDRLAGPLGLRATSLGVREGDGSGRLGVEVQLPEDQQGSDWHWNSPYWRGLGAPWGGLLSTAADLARVIAAVGGGFMGAERVLPPALCRAALQNRTEGLTTFASPDESGPGRRSSTFTPQSGGEKAAWGLGWRLNAGSRQDRQLFGDLASAKSFGHTGATGTAFWYDPEYDLACVLLTSDPGSVRRGLMNRVSNAVAAAVVA